MLKTDVVILCGHTVRIIICPLAFHRSSLSNDMLDWIGTETAENIKNRKEATLLYLCSKNWQERWALFQKHFNVLVAWSIKYSLRDYKAY